MNGTRSISLALLLALAGCDGAAVTADGGTDAPTDARGDASHDARVDEDAPRVVSSTPDDGSTDVDPATDVVITFSEPMADTGTLTVRADGVDVELTRELAGAELTIRPTDGWPAASEIEVRLDTDFEDLAGNELALPFVMRFTVDDTGAPRVVASTPAESGASISTRVGALRIEFSERMDQAAGTVALEGGPGAVDTTTPTWGSTHVTYALTGLAHDTSYRIVLSGFRDLAGNALDGTAYLGDGAIDFATGSDDEAPQVVDTTPNESQVDVSPTELGTITVVFDEDMDTSITSAPLSGGRRATLTGTWEDARTIQFDVEGALSLAAAHALDLRGMRDVAGVALAATPVLGDGRLDFTTGADAFVPFVAASEPAEGATNVANPLREARLAFSEAMDESIAEVIVTPTGGASETVEGTWSNGGTVLTIPGSAFTPGRTYAIDVRGLRDLAGVAVSDAHAYLGDGILNFALARPTGESCAQPLELEHATTIESGVYTFLITSAQRTRYNGSASCDWNGIAGGDAVIHVRKTTPAPGDPSGNGRALRIRTYSVTNRANVEVLSGICDPRDAATTRVRCSHEHANWDIPLAVGPGDYYVWVSTETTSAFDIRVSIEEVADYPEGQSCFDPYDTSSAIYTAPATPDAPHVFEVPASTSVSNDITDSNGRYQGFSCIEGVQDDVVVRFDKAADDTLLDVRIVTGGSWRVAEIVAGGCQRTEPGASSVGCGSLPSTADRFTVHAPSGPVYVWLGSPLTSDPFAGARVEIREIPAPTEPGSTCANAIPIAAGATVPITPSFAQHVDGPSCLPESSGVTWYALTTTEQLTHVRTDLDGAIALVDGTSGAESSCVTTAVAGPLTHFAPIGSRLCIAVQSGAAISSLAIEPIHYTGVGATPPTTLPVPTRPSLESTPHDDSVLTNESWMVLTPSRILQSVGLLGVMDLPRAGGTIDLHLDVDIRVMGNDAVALGEGVFMVAQNTTANPRLFRIRDASGTWSPVAWDRGTPSGVYTGQTKSLVTDGVDIYGISSTSSISARTQVYRWPGDAPGAATRIAEITGVYDIAGSAMDESNVYLCGRTASGSGATVRGLYRVARADLMDDALGTATLVANIPVATNVACQVAIDDATAAHYLYIRDEDGNVHVISDPGTTPRWLGRIFRGDSENWDLGMDMDRTTGTLVLFSTRDHAETGDWFELHP